MKLGYPRAGPALASMVSQRSLDTRRQLAGGHDVAFFKHDRPVSLELELVRIHRSKRVHERRLAVDVHGVLRRPGLLPADPDRTSRPGLRGDVSRLAPFQGFLDFAHAV